MIVKTLTQGAKGLLLIVVVLLAAYAGWRWGDMVFPRVQSVSSLRNAVQDAESNQATQEAAQAAMARIQAFRASDDPELRLTSFEVSSLLRYTIPGMLPTGVIQPRISMSDDRIDIEVSVLPGEVAELPDLGAITGMLPDTVPVSVSGSLVPHGDGGSMLLVHGIRIQGVPVPAAAFPAILVAMGRRDAQGLPASGLLVPALGAIKGVYIENGELVLVRA